MATWKRSFIQAEVDSAQSGLIMQVKHCSYTLNAQPFIVTGMNA